MTNHFVDWVCAFDDTMRRGRPASPDDPMMAAAAVSGIAIKRIVLIPGLVLMWRAGVRSGHCRLSAAGRLGVAGVVGTALVAGAVKSMVARRRPDDGLGSRRWGEASGARSFPSGHAGNVFAAATAVACTAGDPALSVAAFTGAAALAGGRVLCDRHWTSDVVAGAGLGIAVTAGLALILGSVVERGGGR